MGFFDKQDSSANDEINSLLLDPFLDPETRSVAKQVRSLTDKATNLGYDAQLTEPRSSLFMDLLDTLDAPGQGVRGVIDTALRGDMFTGDVGTGFRRGQIENVSSSDILRRNDLIDNPIARGVVGFAGDIFTDPLSYLSLGTTAAGKLGGRAVTEAGAALGALGTERLVARGVTNSIEQGSHLDEVFRSINRRDVAEKAFNATSSESEKALEAWNMSKEDSIIGSLFSREELDGAKVFEKPGLHAGINVPFLGHITQPDAKWIETVHGDLGPVGKVFRGLGKALKPGRVKLADVEFSDEMMGAIDNIRHFTNEKLAQLPVIGAGVKAFEATRDAMAKMFNRKFLIGADANDVVVETQHALAANKAKASQGVIDIIGEDALKDKQLQKDAYRVVDALAMSSVGDVTDNSVFDVIQRIRRTGEVLDGDALLVKKFTEEGVDNGAGQLVTREQKFREGLTNYLASPDRPPAEKALVQRVIGGMDQIAVEEAQDGLQHGILEYYIPHRYKNIAQQETNLTRKSGGNSFFTKERKYDTINDAWKEKGYVADTDLANVLQYRINKSLDLRSQTQYAHRLMVEEAIPETLLRNVYKEAMLNPAGDAAKALKRYRVKLDPSRMAMAAEGADNAAFAEALKPIFKGEPAEAAAVSNVLADTSVKMKNEGMSAGFKPLDNHLPDGWVGELGTKVQNGKETLILPKPIAQAFQETVAARDILKDKLTGDFGKATLGALDHGISFFKKFVTLPWPGYWAQNFVGDRFNQAMAGIHAANPGILARTHSVLKGDSSITNGLGMILDKPTIDRVIKEMGLNYSTNDFVGVVKNFDEMNVDKLLAKKNNSFLTNLLGKDGNKAAALSQAQDGMQRGFDGFFRVSHMVHRFEQGDTIQDAVKAANNLYFNYRDMSPVEASLFRRFYMFYGYMSKATKQTLTNLVTNPGNLTMQLHGTNALAEFFSSPDAAPTADEHDMKLLMSAPSSETLSRVIGRTPEGKPLTARGFAAPLNAVMQQFSAQTPRNFSVGELINTAVDSTTRSIQKQFATSNPVINAAAQAITGKNLFFDKPLDSAFLRKLPDWTAAAEQLAGFAHNDIPVTISDEIKDFLGAVPDGKGRLIADKGKMWVLTNLIPGMSRLVSTAGSFSNADVPTSLAALRYGTGINIDDADPSRMYLSSKRDELEQFFRDKSIYQQLRNQKEQQ